METALIERSQEELQLGVVYPSEFSQIFTVLHPRRNIWFPGKATHQLVQDGIDLAILHTSLESGNTKLLHAEDFEEKALSNGAPTDTIERKLLQYIYQHRKEYGEAIFEANGLIRISYQQYPTDLPSHIFRAEENLDTLSTDSFLYFKFNKVKGYPIGNWGLYLNLTSEPIIVFNWDNTQGLTQFAKKIESRDTIIELEACLTLMGSNRERINRIKYIEENRGYLINDSESTTMQEALKNFREDVLLPSYPKWKASFNFTSTGGGNGIYPNYLLGIHFRLEPKEDNLLSSEENKVQSKDIRQTLEPLMLSLGFGVAFPAYEIYTGDRTQYDHSNYSHSLLFTKNYETLAGNQEELEKFVKDISAITLF